MGIGRILALDIGGSKTEVIVYDVLSNKVVQRLIREPCKIHDMPIERIRSNIHKIFSDVDLNYREDLVSMGIAGLDTRYDVETWWEIIYSVLPKESAVLMMHDVKMMYYAARYGDPCIVVIAGTGFNTYGSDGSISAKAGDWGWKIGDEASAYKIGVSILNQVFRFVDGRGGSVRIYKEVLSWLGLSDWGELLHWVYSSGVGEIAALAILGCRLVDNDIVKGIFNQAVVEALESIRAVSKRVGIKGPIYYTGGLFRCKYFREKFVDVLGDAGYKLGRYIEYPIVGALVKAFKEYFKFGSQEIINRCLDIEMQIKRLGVESSSN